MFLTVTFTPKFKYNNVLYYLVILTADSHLI